MRPARDATLPAPLSRDAVRVLRGADAAAVAALARRLGWPGDPPEWSRVISRRDAIAVGLEIEGALAGYAVATVRLAFGIGVPVGWIEHFGVDVTRRGSGVGRALSDALLARLREAGVRRVATLVPLHDRELAPFFREIGFSEEPRLCLGREL